MYQAKDVLVGWRDLSIDLVDGFGVVAEGRRRGQGFGLEGHADFGAIVADAKHGQFQRVLFDQIGQAQQDSFSFNRGCF